ICCSHPTPCRPRGSIICRPTAWSNWGHRSPSDMTPAGQTSWRREAALTLGALGVVFGDIGTSPLCAMKLSVQAEGGGVPTVAAVFGATSLIFWSLLIVVTVKYVVFIMRADNNGEGGVMALAALAHRSSGLGRGIKVAIALASLAGLALFYGDGMLTPAVSVLSALEGVGSESASLK